MPGPPLGVVAHVHERQVPEPRREVGDVDRRDGRSRERGARLRVRHAGDRVEPDGAQPAGELDLRRRVRGGDQQLGAGRERPRGARPDAAAAGHPYKAHKLY